MENGYYLLVASVLSIALYKWLGVRISALAQPLRFEMIEIEEDLLAYGHLTAQEKRLLRSVMDSAFSRRTAWRLVTIFPFAFLWRGRSGREAEKRFAALPASDQKKVNRFLRIGTVATLSTSPLALTIFMFEMVFAALIVAPIGRLLKRTIQHIVDGDNGNPPHQLAH